MFVSELSARSHVLPACSFSPRGCPLANQLPPPSLTKAHASSRDTTRSVPHRLKKLAAREMRDVAALSSRHKSPGCEPKTGNIAAAAAPRKNDTSRSTLWRSERALPFTAVLLIQGAATML